MLDLAARAAHQARLSNLVLANIGSLGVRKLFLPHGALLSDALPGSAFDDPPNSWHTCPTVPFAQ